MGWFALAGWFIAKSVVRTDRLNRVGKFSNGLFVVDPEDCKVTGCFGMPKRSSRRAFGCNKCGWSANGSASDMGISNGSGGGQPKHNVDSDLWNIVTVTISATKKTKEYLKEGVFTTFSRTVQISDVSVYWRNVRYFLIVERFRFHRHRYVFLFFIFIFVLIFKMIILFWYILSW